MYKDSVYQWNVFVGCKFKCSYCEKSFQRQMKRQKQNCMKCYRYEPHFHPERIEAKLPSTPNGSFIWACSSSDITSICGDLEREKIFTKILNRIKKESDKTFLFQSKDPACFNWWAFPKNVILCTTIESNRFYNISLAPTPENRYLDFSRHPHPRKFVTIEPIQDFDHDILVEWIKEIKPQRVYIGYDSKGCNLPEPSVEKTKKLIESLKLFTDVRVKLLPKKTKQLEEFC